MIKVITHVFYHTYHYDNNIWCQIVTITLRRACKNTKCRPSSTYNRNQIKDITFLAGQRLCNYFFVRLKCVLSSTHSGINTRVTNFTIIFLCNWFTKTKRLNTFQFKNIFFKLIRKVLEYITLTRKSFPNSFKYFLYMFNVRGYVFAIRVLHMLYRQIIHY